MEINFKIDINYIDDKLNGELYEKLIFINDQCIKKMKIQNAWYTL